MADERDEDRTEPATPRRRQEARARGQVARSADLSSAAVLLAGVIALRLAGPRLLGGLFASTGRALEELPDLEGDSAGLRSLLGSSLGAALLGFLPFAGILWASGLAAGLGQVGFLFTLRPLAPESGRIDPVAGLGRLLSLRSLARLLAGLLKLSLVALVVGGTLWGERSRLLTLGGGGFDPIPGTVADLMLRLSLRASGALFVLALLDYGFQKWQHERDLRMSKREVQEELRRYEGDPRIRQRRRAIQAQIALDRMILGVPRATVVVANSTDLAVAVRYDRSLEAPEVVAKGSRQLARRIREAALEHGIPIVERKDLARELYRGVEVGQAIPATCFQPVAELLAYVYRVRGMAAAP